MAASLTRTIQNRFILDVDEAVLQPVRDLKKLALRLEAEAKACEDEPDLDLTPEILEFDWKSAAQVEKALKEALKKLKSKAP